MVCSLVFTSGAGTSRSGSDEVDDLGGVAARERLQFAIGEHVRIADHAALAAAERDVDHRAFPGHPGGQRAHFVQRHVGREADAALGRAARDGVLHAIAGEDFQPAVVQLHRDVDGDLAWRACAEPCACRRRASSRVGGFVEARFGGEPGILFLLEREREWASGSSGFIMTNAAVNRAESYGADLQVTFRRSTNCPS